MTVENYNKITQKRYMENEIKFATWILQEVARRNSQKNFQSVFILILIYPIAEWWSNLHRPPILKMCQIRNAYKIIWELKCDHSTGWIRPLRTRTMIHGLWYWLKWQTEVDGERVDRFCPWRPGLNNTDHDLVEKTYQRNSISWWHIGHWSKKSSTGDANKSQDKIYHF